MTMHLLTDGKQERQDIVPAWTDARFAGRFIVSSELLCEVLKLPAGVKLRHCIYDPAYDRFELIVEGDRESGLPVREPGERVSIIVPQYQYDAATDKTTFIGW